MPVLLSKIAISFAHVFRMVVKPELTRGTHDSSSALRSTSFTLAVSAIVRARIKARSAG